MIACVTVGADDIVRAKRFYSAFLPALDCGLEEGPEGLSYALTEQLGQSAALPLCRISTLNQPLMDIPPRLGTVL